MTVWAEPKFDKEAINSAGKMLVRSARENWANWGIDDWEEYSNAIDVINNWRGSHGYPLNTFQVNLRNTCRRFEQDALIAQRIKRLSSIRHKLDRFPSMKLSQMQDLGGCRAILSNVTNVFRVFDYYQNESSAKHIQASVDDYISAPKSSGYRGIHLVYRYFSDKKKAMYNGLKIEMQLRSRYQHAWATAVETAGMFSGQALKSSLGSEDWKRFFSLIGSAIALRERAPLVPDTPARSSELFSELRHYADKLKVQDRLREYGKALRYLTDAQDGAHYYLLQLDPKNGTLLVTGFKQNQVELAEKTYAQAEQLAKDKAETDAVLVSVESVTALSRAYPNYFADTRLFLVLLEQALSGRSRSIRLPSLKLEQLPLPLTE
ncbi:RelA/SpoT domain-containing protein [Azospira restricta]|uniref:RelA/SpoT domain-containing protein n=1 Tax=Azospira restricta TaxID=404405 RepID=A0A974SRN6_9RHOO|nr:RelA/SpoT domain-containing protein [Azospira restricta]QRJ65266.1 RelA/SpoT domain-containing protein [Azospira restricta]